MLTSGGIGDDRGATATSSGLTITSETGTAGASSGLTYVFSNFWLIVGKL